MKDRPSKTKEITKNINEWTSYHTETEKMHEEKFNQQQKIV